MKKTIPWVLVLASIIAGGALVAMTTTPPNLSKALEAQQQRVTENPADPAAYNDLGNLLVLAERLDEAEEAYREAIDLAPEEAQAHFNLALLLQRTRQPGAAAKQLQTVLDLEPENAWAHYQLGSIYEGKGSKGQAIHHYGRAFALDHRLADAKFNPQVIENRLVVESMLKGYPEVAARPIAPSAYGGPGPIRDLMIARDAMEDLIEDENGEGEDAMAAESEMGQSEMDKSEMGKSGEARSQASWAGSEDSEEPAAGALPAGEAGDEMVEEDDEPRTRVLNSSSIDRGSATGQAVPMGRGRSSARGRSSGGRSTTTFGSGTRTTRPSRSTSSGRSGTRSRVPYVPPSSSTGSLDLDLIPQRYRGVAPSETQPVGASPAG
ncbi:MAG: tetratricopeptide repeat protein [Acidobacteriota bacterium]|nr:tetratricopeptide repeat protein [Acidobacteriota bacterium]